MSLTPEKLSDLKHRVVGRQQSFMSYHDLLQNDTIKICPHGKCPKKIIDILKSCANSCQELQNIILELADD